MPGVPSFAVHIPLPAHELHEGSWGLETSGGCLALWLLAGQLRTLGHPVEVFGFEGPPDGSPVARALRSGETTAVLPEAVDDNPWRATHVERWVLYHAPTERLQRFRARGERLWFYWDAFRPPDTPGQTLRAFDAGLDRFYSLGHQRRGTCLRIAKGSDYHAQPGRDIRSELEEAARAGLLPAGLEAAVREPIDRVPDHMTRAQMQETFNRYRLFISYDWASATSAIAALCGCRSVIVERPGYTHEDMLPCFRTGIALGLAGLAEAERTLPLVRETLRLEEDEARRTVARFAAEAAPG